MLVPKNMNPDDCIYYKATFVIKVLLSNRQLTLTDLFVEVNRRCKMSYFVFMLCLDWLYLIGCVRYTNDTIPQITLCT